MRAVSPVLTALFFCSSLSGFAQQGASSSPLTPPTESATSSSGRRITLDVVVTDKSGKPVPGLQQQDFTVLDDKQPQKILSFSATDETGEATGSPEQVILLVDAVNNSFDGVGYERLQPQLMLGLLVARSALDEPVFATELASTGVKGSPVCAVRIIFICQSPNALFTHDFPRSNRFPFPNGM